MFSLSREMVQDLACACANSALKVAVAAPKAEIRADISA